MYVKDMYALRYGASYTGWDLCASLLGVCIDADVII